MLLEIGREFNNHDGDQPWPRDLAGVVTVAEIYKVRKETHSEGTRSQPQRAVRISKQDP